MSRIMLVGAAGGIGRSTIRQLMAQGHNIVGLVANDDERSFLAAEIPALTDLFVVDLADAVGALEAVKGILSLQSEPLDGLIVCSGWAPYGPIETFPLAAFKRLLEINTVANAALYQAALPYLRKTGGRIIFLSSYAGKVGMPLVGFYAASKHALEGMADVMRTEAAQFGVSVILVQPGAVRTAMLSSFTDTLEDRLAAMSENERAHYGDYFRQYKNVTDGQADLICSPDDVAAVIGAALSDESPKARYVVGADASALIDARRQMEDPEFDAFVRSQFPGRPAL